MNINNKLTKAISEVNYLRAENVDRYRIIIRYFYEEYEKINYHLYKEDVYKMMMDTNLFKDYTIDQCVSDLNALVEWNNLTPIQDVSKVNTIDEFKNRKFRYQLNRYTIEIERMMIKLENLEIEGSSLESSLLDRIHDQIIELKTILNKDDKYISYVWNNLNNDFIRLNQSYQDYIRTLNSANAEEMMKTREFLIFKEKIINYLRTFVKSLQENAVILEAVISRYDNELIDEILKRAIRYELSIPRIDVQLDENELYKLYLGRYKSIYKWFVGNDDSISEVSRMSDITNDIIRKITRYAQQISEYKNLNTNKAEEYRHIADIFGQCQNIEEAHKLSSLVFGVDHTFHIKNINSRKTDDIDSGVYDENVSYLKLEPRTRIKSERLSRKPANNYDIEIKNQSLMILRKREIEKEILEKMIEKKVIDFKELGTLDIYSRKLILGWLSRALANKNHISKTQNGKYYRVDSSDEEVIKLKCEDGDLYTKAYKIYFLDGDIDDRN